MEETTALAYVTIMDYSTGKVRIVEGHWGSDKNGIIDDDTITQWLIDEGYKMSQISYMTASHLNVSIEIDGDTITYGD